ncbi:terminase small subunit [Bacillus infantis]|uniref:terminase small subunit n=1 Tax=Bacillus infantis TaxID=324767 RepID=UPI003CEF19C3
MSAKQQRFCDEYLIDLNATQAAIRAGYSKRNARNIASENLAKPNIQAYISARMAEKDKELIADQDEVLRYLTSVLRGESLSSELVIESAMGISTAKEMQKKPSEKDRLRAAELLGKRYGIYTERIETDVDMELNINIDYGDDAE